jgi:hypothetical protein
MPVFTAEESAIDVDGAQPAEFVVAAARPRGALPGWLALPTVGAVAAVGTLLGGAAPMVGAPVFAVVFGIAIEVVPAL